MSFVLLSWLIHVTTKALKFTFLTFLGKGQQVLRYLLLLSFIHSVLPLILWNPQCWSKAWDKFLPNSVTLGSAPFLLTSKFTPDTPQTPKSKTDDAEVPERFEQVLLQNYEPLQQRCQTPSKCHHGKFFRGTKQGAGMHLKAAPSRIHYNSTGCWDRRGLSVQLAPICHRSCCKLQPASTDLSSKVREQVLTPTTC